MHREYTVSSKSYNQVLFKPQRLEDWELSFSFIVAYSSTSIQDPQVINAALSHEAATVNRS